MVRHRRFLDRKRSELTRARRTWTTYTTADGLADNYVVAIASDMAGNKRKAKRMVWPS